MAISVASLGDVVEISRVHIEAEQETYSRIQPSWLEHVSGPFERSRIWQVALGETHLNTICLLARSPFNTLVGFLAGTFPDRTRQARINSLYVLRAYQRHGYGKELLAAFATEALRKQRQEITCMTPSVNHDGRHFVEWCGGIETQEDFLAPRQGVELTEYAWQNVDALLRYLSGV